MSNSQIFNAGEAKGTLQAKTDQVVQSAKDTATLVTDKTSEAATATQEKAKTTVDAAQGKPEPGFMQQTGTHIQNMTQGAVETVKNTFGVGEEKK